MVIGFTSAVKLCNAARVAAVAASTVTGVLTSIALASAAVPEYSVSRFVAVSLIVSAPVPRLKPGSAYRASAVSTEMVADVLERRHDVRQIG